VRIAGRAANDTAGMFVEGYDPNDYARVGADLIAG
jgi:hypothetical protein